MVLGMGTGRQWGAAGTAQKPRLGGVSSSRPLAGAEKEAVPTSLRRKECVVHVLIATASRMKSQILTIKIIKI